MPCPVAIGRLFISANGLMLTSLACSQCISIASRALNEGDLAKAAKFSIKARQLFSCKEVNELDARIDAARSGHTTPQASPSSRAHSTPSGHDANGHGTHGHHQHHAHAGGREAHTNGTSTSAGATPSTGGPAGMGGSRRQAAASEPTAARKRHADSKPAAVDENAVSDVMLAC